MWEVLETMRVISQDGTMDFPYEISTIFIYPRIENVIAIQSAGDSEISIIGRYSSKDVQLVFFHSVGNTESI